MPQIVVPKERLVLMPRLVIPKALRKRLVLMPQLVEPKALTKRWL